MSAPSFLAGNYRYLLLTGVTDVNSIIAALNTELVTNGVWTDTGGSGTGPFRSPSRAYDGSYMQITLTRVSATRLQWQCYDHLGYLINNQTATCQDIDAGGSAVHILTGPDIVLVDVDRTTPECFYVARLNDYPETNVASSFVCSRGPRSSSGTLNYQQLQYVYNREIEATSYSSTCYAIMRCPNQSYVSLQTFLGDYLYVPFEFCGGGTTPSNRLLGKVPQMVLCTSNLAYGASVSIPVDAGVNYTFRVCGITAHQYRRLLMRTA